LKNEDCKNWANCLTVRPVFRNFTANNNNPQKKITTRFFIFIDNCLVVSQKSSTFAADFEESTIYS